MMKLTVANYRKALVYDLLSSQAHELSLYDGALMGADYDSPSGDISSELHKKARKLFPLYPHADYAAANEWLHKQGIDV